MPWKPRHEAHAIERVRVLIPFKEPLPRKLLQASIADVVNSKDQLGFTSVEPATSGIATINLNLPPGAVAKPEPAAVNGVVLKRFAGAEVVEELGFRDVAFGYVTTRYGRWENLRHRLSELVLPPLQKIDEAAEIANVRLEYWDAFIFDGNHTEASLDGFICMNGVTVPEEVKGGRFTWHSHTGWFEGSAENPILINRNLDAIDRQTEVEEVRRILNIYTLVEKRSIKSSIGASAVPDELDFIHKISLTIFGSVLTEPYRNQIGIDLEAYK